MFFYLLAYHRGSLLCKYVLNEWSPELFQIAPRSETQKVRGGGREDKGKNWKISAFQIKVDKENHQICPFPQEKSPSHGPCVFTLFISQTLPDAYEVQKRLQQLTKVKAAEWKGSGEAPERRHEGTGAGGREKRTAGPRRPPGLSPEPPPATLWSRSHYRQGSPLIGARARAL